MTPDDPTTPDPPADRFTLDEWIAATQSCCGIDPPDEPATPPTPGDS